MDAEPRLPPLASPEGPIITEGAVITTGPVITEMPSNDSNEQSQPETEHENDTENDTVAHVNEINPISGNIIV